MEESTAGYLLLFAFLMILEVLYSAFWSVIRSLNENEIEKKEELLGKKRTDKIIVMIKKSGQLENTVLIVISLIGIAIGALYMKPWFIFCQNLFIDKNSYIGFLSSFPPWVVTILILLVSIFIFVYLLLTFTMIIPRYLALHIPMKQSCDFAIFVYYCSTLFQPFIYLIGVTAKGLLRICGIKKAKMESDVTEEEIISMVNEGHEQGVLEASEAEMITNIFEFGDKQAKDIMTNRSNITAIDADMLLPEAIDFMISEKNSRYPVYEENLDHIIGILNFKDAIRFQAFGKRPRGKVKSYPELLREAEFIPETRNIDDLFQKMQSDKTQMVIVIDEYGQTAGLVAMEDILEEIVGNILDEYDEEEEYIEETGDHQYTMDGLTRLEDLEEQLGITFLPEEFETLNGFIIYYMEHIPTDGEHFEMDYEGYHFKVLNVENKMIKTVLVKKNPVMKQVEETEK